MLRLGSTKWIAFYEKGIRTRATAVTAVMITAFLTTPSTQFVPPKRLWLALAMIPYNPWPRRYLSPVARRGSMTSTPLSAECSLDSGNGSTVTAAALSAERPALSQIPRFAVVAEFTSLALSPLLTIPSAISVWNRLFMSQSHLTSV